MKLSYRLFLLLAAGAVGAAGASSPGASRSMQTVMDYYTGALDPQHVSLGS